mgnify:CR=1 FL=1
MRKLGKLGCGDVGRIAHEAIEGTFHTLDTVAFDDFDELLKSKHLDVCPGAGHGLGRHVRRHHLRACLPGKRTRDATRTASHLEHARGLDIRESFENDVYEHLGLGARDEHAAARCA